MNKVTHSDASIFTTISEEEWLKGGSELNQKMAAACQLGFFYLEIPADCKPLIPEAVKFSNSFYKDEKIRQLQLPDFCGYHDRPWQAESLFLDPKDWKAHLPPDVDQLAKRMHELSLQIFKTILRLIEIPEKDWAEGSGGLTEGRGWIHFCVNHYRAEKDGIGMEEHKDMGQVTVLYMHQEGLEMKHQGEWIDVSPVENHFIINFGNAFETFVNRKEQLIAALHQVRHVADRISFGIFSENNPDAYLCERSSTGELIRKKIYKEYIAELLQPTLN